MCLRSTPQREGEISPLSLRGKGPPGLSLIGSERAAEAENAELTSTLLSASGRTSPPSKRAAASPGGRNRASPGGRNRGRLGPKAVDFKSPPRAVFANSAAARQARLDAHNRVLHLSDAEASAPHVARLGECEAAMTATCPLGTRFQSYEPTGSVHSFEPVPMRLDSRQSANSDASAGALSSGSASCLVGVASVRPASRQSSQSTSGSMMGISFSRDASSSSLSLMGVGGAGSGSRQLTPHGWRGNVDTPPSAAIAFEAAEELRLCRAPKAMRVRCDAPPRKASALSIPTPPGAAPSAAAATAAGDDAAAGGEASGARRRRLLKGHAAADEAGSAAASTLDDAAAGEKTPPTELLSPISPRFRPVQLSDDFSSESLL